MITLTAVFRLWQWKEKPKERNKNESTPKNDTKSEIVSDGKEKHLMKTKILPNTFISVGVLFVVADFVAAAVRHYKLAAEVRLLTARTSDGVLNSGNRSLRLLPIITSDVPDAGTGPNHGQRHFPTPRQAGSFCSPLFLRIARHNSPHPGPESDVSKKKDRPPKSPRETIEPSDWNWWRQAMMGGASFSYSEIGDLQ
jgi:hypothetical protein